MNRPLWFSLLVLTLHYAGQAVPLGPELVLNGGFETRFAGWTNQFWGNDAPPHSGARAAFSISEFLGESTLDQLISGLIPGASYQVSFWAGNSFQSDTPNSNGIQVSLGADTFSTFDVGEPYQEFSFIDIPGQGSEPLHITGFNNPRAFFLDDVSIRQVLPDPSGAPELDQMGAQQAAGVILLLLLLGAPAGGAEGLRSAGLCSGKRS